MGLQISESRGGGEIKIPGGGGLHFARGRDRPGGGIGLGYYTGHLSYVENGHAKNLNKASILIRRWGG